MLLRVIHRLEALLSDLDIHCFASHVEYVKDGNWRKIMGGRETEDPSENLQDVQWEEESLIAAAWSCLAERFWVAKRCVDPIKE